MEHDRQVALESSVGGNHVGCNARPSTPKVFAGTNTENSSNMTSIKVEVGCKIFAAEEKSFAVVTASENLSLPPFQPT